MWGISLCAGSSDLITMATAPTTDRLFDYIMREYRNPKDKTINAQIVQTVTYLLNKSSYVVKQPGTESQP